MKRLLLGIALCLGLLAGCGDDSSNGSGGSGGTAGSGGSGGSSGQQCSGSASGSCVYTSNCIEYYGVDYANIEASCKIGTPSMSPCSTADSVGFCHQPSFDGSCSVTVDYQSFSTRDDSATLCVNSGGTFVDP